MEDNEYQKEEIDLIDEVDKSDPEVRAWTTKPVPRLVLSSVIGLGIALFIGYAIGIFGSSPESSQSEEEKRPQEGQVYALTPEQKENQELRMRLALAEQKKSGQKFSTKPSAKPSPPAVVRAARRPRTVPRPKPVARAFAPKRRPPPPAAVVRVPPKPQVSDAQVESALRRLGVAPETSPSPPPPPSEVFDLSTPLEPGAEPSPAKGPGEDLLSSFPLDPGASASGRLATPIVFASDFNSTGDRYLIELSDHLGGGVVPAKSVLITKLGRQSGTGLLSLEVETIVMEDKEVSVAPGAIVIVGKDGSPLQAKRKGGGAGGQIATNLGLALLSGVSGATSELINQGTTSISGNGTTVVDSFSSPLAGFVDGTTQSIVRGMEQRLRQRNSSQPIFVVKPDTQVRIVVSQKVEV